MKKLIKIISLIIISLIGYYFLNKTINLSIPCIFNKLTGLYCPGCGITRMLFSLLELKFYQSFRYNPLLFVYLFYYLIIYIIYFFKNKKLYKLGNKEQITLIIILLSYTILRNIPYFSYLAPTKI